VQKHFETRFAAQPRLGVNPDGIYFKSISIANNEMLSRVFSEHEILEVVSQCDSTKSLSPENYNFYFLKNNWDIVGIMKSSSTEGCNASCITLVPKRDNSFTLNEFRLISLVGCVYKLIFKMLANRLK